MLERDRAARDQPAKVRNVNEEISAIADEILEYVEHNPHSSDTLDGIMRWWLKENTYSSTAVWSALEYLVKEKKLRKMQRADGEDYYSAWMDSN